MSINIKIRNAKKVFSGQTVIPDLSLDVRDGEFFTLLGPSGCGKTTLLRMIAGFNSIEGGNFYFNSSRINDISPNKRNIGMVFQNYAVFPNLTVRKNVAFGLGNRKIPKAEIDRRVDNILELMQLQKLKDRMPQQLSGGQQQRVALARALVIEPDVLLMDEPLSNLDAKLRVEMRSAIKDIQKAVGITTIYVTHDQEEAMAVSDRIAVMKEGVIQQIGTPRGIYQRPANMFVSSFIGLTNMFDGRLCCRDKKWYVRFNSGYEAEAQGIADRYKREQPVKVPLRPEDLKISDDDKRGIRAQVKNMVFLGANTHYTVVFDTGETADIIQESAIDHFFAAGESLRLVPNAEKMNIFTSDGEQVNILESVRNDLDLLS